MCACLRRGLPLGRHPEGVFVVVAASSAKSKKKATEAVDGSPHQRRRNPLPKTQNRETRHWQVRPFNGGHGRPEPELNPWMTTVAVGESKPSAERWRLASDGIMFGQAGHQRSAPASVKPVPPPKPGPRPPAHHHGAALPRHPPPPCPVPASVSALARRRKPLTCVNDMALNPLYMFRFFLLFFSFPVSTPVPVITGLRRNRKHQLQIIKLRSTLNAPHSVTLKLLFFILLNEAGWNQRRHPTVLLLIEMMRARPSAK